MSYRTVKSFFSLILVSFVLLVAPSADLHASENYNYTQYWVKKGLCDDDVTHTFIDSDGYVWFSTSNGLDRFDGGEFVHYSTMQADAHYRISSNRIAMVAEDSHHHLWVATSLGLSVIDLSTGWVIADALTDVEDIALQSSIHFMTAGENNDLWLCVHNRVVCLLLDESGHAVSLKSVTLTDDAPSCLSVASPLVWVGGQHGLYLLTSSPEGLTVQPAYPTLPLQEVSEVNTILSHGAYLWIGTHVGLYRYDTKNKELKHYFHNDAVANSLINDNVSSLAINHSGDLLISTALGLDVLGHDATFRHLPLARSSHNASVINHVRVDDSDCIWASTMVEGVILLSPNYIDYTVLFEGPQSDPNIVTRVFEDHDGNLLVSILGKGLAICHAGQNQLYYIKEYAYQNILSICQDGNGDCWISSVDGGLSRLSLRDRQHPVVKPVEISQSATANPVNDICYDQQRQGLWLVAGSSLLFYDLQSQQASVVSTSLPLSDLMPYTLLHDTKDRLWIGGTGLAIVDLTKQDAQDRYQTNYYRYKLDDQESRMAERISVIYESPDGTIYLGSQNNGLFKCVETAGADPVFKRVTINYASFHNKVSSLLEDSRHYLWVSAPEGLYCYDIMGDKTVKADEGDGLPSLGFFDRSGIRMSAGQICFGSANGLLCLNSELSTLAEINRKPRITHILTNDVSLLPGDASTVDISPDHQFVEIFYSAQEYVDPDEVLYRYKIDEIDKDWNLAINGHQSIRYTMLPPGRYTFRISCTNPDNVWAEQESVIYLIVHPHYYQTWWFKCLILLLILSLATARIYTYSRRQKRIQRQLQEEVNLQADRLVEQKENSNREKLQLFTSLTHEFKTPLTLILGPAKELALRNKDNSLTENIDIIKRNTDYMISLVDRILELRRVGASQEEIPDLATFIKTSSELLPQPVTSAVVTEHQVGKPTLLLAEDNDDMRTFIRSILSEHYYIIEAVNGEEGYRQAKENMPDFIISDYMMPVNDGLQFCQNIRQDESVSHIPFLMLTALSSDQVRLDCYRAGVDAFLTKPFEKELLLARIENIMLRRRQRQQEVTFNLSDAYSRVEIEDTDKLFMERLISVIEENYSIADFGVAELQEKLNMSGTSLYKKVTALTGLTSTQFIRLYRLQTAHKILENSQSEGAPHLSIAELAYRVGFNDPKYFTRCFVKQYGVQPSSFLQ